MNAPTPNQSSIREIFEQQTEALKLENRGMWEQSLARFRQALARDDRDPEIHVAMARCHRRLGEHKAAITVLEGGLRSCGPSLRLYRWLIQLLEECNRTREAIAVAHEGMIAFPADIWLKLKAALLLPILYDTPEEVAYYRRRFGEGLETVRQAISLDTPESKRHALSAIGNHTNVFLGYQGGNDRQLQVLYGDLVHKIMAANFPQWTKPVTMPSAPANGQLRIGYLSSRFRNLSATKYFLGWLRERTPERIVTYAYDVGRKTDTLTEEVRRASNYFRQVSSLEETCQVILDDALHVLVYLDIGMDPLTTQLAALRLAPIQCVAWDQPITSGLSTIDYFISSELAEPEDAQDHYSEKLVLLPGVGVCYEKPVIPSVLLSKTRRDFGIRDDAIVYLCCQYLFKYLPGQDAVFAKIASSARNAQFVFVTENELVAGDLRRRLGRAFSAEGVLAEEHCILLPAVDRLTYWNLCLIGDVFLDTIGWTGGVSSFEAIACRLPVVTLPGKYMRGRQSFAILTQLGVTETIAHDEKEYVELAIRLGLDCNWRAQLVRQMTDGYGSLYSDKRCVGVLEDFFIRKVDQYIR